MPCRCIPVTERRRCPWPQTAPINELFVLYRRLALPVAHARLAADFNKIEKLIDEHGD